MSRDKRRYQAHPTADWMWGPDEPRDTAMTALTIALATAVVVLAFVLVLAVGGFVGTALGFDMAALP